MEKQVIDKLKYLINKKKTTEEIKDILGLEDYEIFGLVYLLKQEGLPYEIINGQIIKVKIPELLNNDVKTINVDNKDEFCFLSDIHYASIYDRPDIVRRIYEECHERGISTIFCCGDVTDGYYPSRKDSLKKVRCSYADDQIDYVINTHPYDKDIAFYMIGGNHDYSHVRNENIDVLKKISEQRKDMVYLGQDEANIQINRLKIKLFHGDWNRRSLLSSNAENFIKTIPFKERPDILQLGHIHRSFFMKSGDINVFQTGSLLDETPYIHDNKIDSERTCWFAQIKYDSDGNIIQIVPELHDYGKSLVRKR